MAARPILRVCAIVPTAGMNRCPFSAEFTRLERFLMAGNILFDSSRELPSLTCNL